MRLINTETFELKVFSDDEAPPYAILSHTWGSDSEELTFSDVTHGIVDKPGIGSFKLKACCKQAKADRIGYAWIDTCCIDKTNLVELGEAINSMFRWYSLAAVCYAYLSDVPDDDDTSVPGSKFRTSRWFKRGWTLQELLAPKDLRFYSSNWRHIGDKGTKSSVIQNITRVPRQFLLGITELQSASVAQRMSWAAQRETKRAEDLAYCLLGIFDIAMPMVYGEGGKAAFVRLQEQIMKTTRDDSILAWGLSNESPMNNPLQFIDGDTFIYGDILAASPSDFANSWQITTREQATNPLHSLDIFGGSLRIYLTIETGEALGLLSCGPKSDTQQVVAIPLAKINSTAANEYVRPQGSSSVLHPIPAPGVLPELIHIKKDGQKNVLTKNQHHLLYEEILFAEIGLHIISVIPEACWDKKRALISQTSDNNVLDQILIQVRQNKGQFLDFVILIDFHEPDLRIELLCCVFTCHRNTALEEMAGIFQRKTLEALRKTSASNGSLNLSVKLGSVERNIASITPEAMKELPYYTIDATMVLENLDSVLGSIQLLWKKKQNDVEMESLSAQIAEKFHLRYINKQRWQKDKKYHLKRINEEQERQKEKFYSHYVFEERWRKEEKFRLIYNGNKRLRVETKENEIAELRSTIEDSKEDFEEEVFFREAFEEYYAKVRESKDKILEQVVLKKSVFDEEKLVEVEETEHAEKRYKIIRERQEEILEQVVQAQKQLKELYRAEGCQDGWTPFRSAMAMGDISMMDLLFDESTDIMAKDRRLLPWIAASRCGDVKQIQSLLATDRSELDRKDGIFGRTPLSWASMNGHLDVVKLILDTKQVDIRSKDNNGRTPMRWALERGHHDIVRLLLQRWDRPAPIHIHWGASHGTLALSHDSELLALGLNEGIIKLWDSKTGKCLHTISGHQDSITSLGFSHNSKLLASGSSYGIVRLWDVETAKCLQTLPAHPDSVTSVAFAYDSRLLASVSRKTTIKLWNSETGRLLHEFQGRLHHIISMVFSRDSKLIASVSFAGNTRLWDSRSAKCLYTIRIDEHDSVSKTPGSGRTTDPKNPKFGRNTSSVQVRGHFPWVTFLHNSKILATRTPKGFVAIRDSKTGEQICTIKGCENFVHPVALSHDLKLVASVASDGRIELYDNTTGECIHKLDTPHTQHTLQDTGLFPGYARAVAHDFKVLALESPKDTIELWDTSIIQDLLNSTRYPDDLLLDQERLPRENNKVKGIPRDSQKMRKIRARTEEEDQTTTVVRREA